MKSYYIVGTRLKDGSQEWTAYMGFSLRKAVKALMEERSKYENYLTKTEKAKNEVFADRYKLPEGIDENDETAVSNAVSDCIGSDPIIFCGQQDFQDSLYHAYAGNNTYCVCGDSIYVVAEHTNSLVRTGASGTTFLGFAEEWKNYTERYNLDYFADFTGGDKVIAKEILQNLGIEVSE